MPYGMSYATYMYVKYFLVYVSWWFIPLVILWILKSRLAKYPVDCTIYEKRGENLVYTNDVAGRFNKPVTCYRLKKSKDTIPIPQYDWIIQNMSRPTNIFERFRFMLAGKQGHITLFKYGSKQYKPIDVKLPNGRVEKRFKEIKDKKGQPVWIATYEFINPRQAMSKIEFEVIDWDDINHMTQELREIAMRRSPIKNFLEKYGGIIGLTIGFLALIIGGYYYKEMMIDAGNKMMSASGGRNVQPQTPQPEQAKSGGFLNGIVPGS